MCKLAHTYEQKRLVRIKMIDLMVTMYWDAQIKLRHQLYWMSNCEADGLANSDQQT
jgi:hypothetical protein